MSIPSFEAQGAGAVVQITLGQVFNEVRQVHDEFKGLGGKLEPMHDQLKDHEERLRKVDGLPERVTGVVEDLDKLDTNTGTALENLNKKVDGLRLRGAMVVGGATVLGAGVGSVVTVLLSHR